MYKPEMLDEIFDKLMDAEFDMECFLEVVTELEGYYEMEEKVELTKKFHFVRTEVDRILSMLHKEIEAMDDYILEARRDSN